MSILKNMLGDDESIFSNADALDPNYVPKLLPHREDQQKYIALAIKPLFNKRTGKTLLIKGSPGIGKTASVKRVLYDLDDVDEAANLPYIFINCWTHNSTFKILTRIAHSLGYRFTHNMNKTQIFEKIKYILSKKDGVIFTFDEIDKTDDYDFLYYLLEDIKNKTLLLITNDTNWGADLDSRIKSRLTPEVLEYQEYNPEEIESILRERIKYAFYQGVWGPDAFRIIVDKAIQFSDIRAGIALLKATGDIAEDAAARKITKEHAEKACEQTEHFKIKNSAALTDEEKIVLNICKENDNKVFGQLYKIYSQTGGDKSEKTFKRLLDKLEKRKIIKQEPVTLEHGRSTKIKFIGLERSLDTF